MAFTGPIEDRLAIRELLDSYADAAFTADKQGWLDCWTDDAVWITPFGEVRGKAQLSDQWDAVWATMDQLGFFAKPGAIAISGDTASGRSYVREIFAAKDGSVQKVVGRYDEEIVRQAGHWRFARRVYTALIREPGR